MRMAAATLRDAVYGAAVGDALGVPFEFKWRGDFECTDMVGYGTHSQPAGTFSDDSSMLLALCDSIRAKRGRIDCDDIRKRFCKWAFEGAYTADGVVFDIGGTTMTALTEGEGRSGERSNGNGSLMRTAPLAFTKASDDEVRAVSAITHAHPISMDACVSFVHVMRALIAGASITEAADLARTEGYALAAEAPEDEVSSGGYVLDTYAASIWCLENTGSYADCVLKAVNLGRDTDTTACVAGALAGVVYGMDAIPASWIETLRGKDVIERCLF